MAEKAVPGHPMQPLVVDASGTVRFRSNAIVRWLSESGRLDLNEIAPRPFGDDDRRQVAQLLGYSVGGFGELSYVDDASYEEAARKMARMGPDGPSDRAKRIATMRRLVGELHRQADLGWDDADEVGRFALGQMGRLMVVADGLLDGVDPPGTTGEGG
jgi:hypothetical protein